MCCQQCGMPCMLTQSLYSLQAQFPMTGVHSHILMEGIPDHHVQMCICVTTLLWIEIW